MGAQFWRTRSAILCFLSFLKTQKNTSGGFSGPLGSKTPPHGPKTPPNHDFLLICVPSGLICRRFLVHIFKKKSQCSCSLVGVRECIFSKKHWNIGNETNKSVGTRPTFLARGRYLTSVCNGSIFQPWLFRSLTFCIFPKLNFSFLMSHILGLRYRLMVYCTPQNPNHLKLTRDSGSGMTPESHENSSIFKPVSKATKAMKIGPKAAQNHEKSTLES